MKKDLKFTVVSSDFVQNDELNDCKESKLPFLYRPQELQMDGVDSVCDYKDPVYFASDKNIINGPPKFIRCQIGLKIQEIERALLIETIKECHGNKKVIASVLGLCEKSIYNKISQHKLDEYLEFQRNKYNDNDNENKRNKEIENE